MDKILFKNANIAGRKGQQFEHNCDQIIQGIVSIVSIIQCNHAHLKPIPRL